jgi:hypothetical protein
MNQTFLRPSSVRGRLILSIQLDTISHATSDCHRRHNRNGMLIDWPERCPLSDEGCLQLDLASRNVCITLIFPAVVGQPHTW